MQPLSHSLSRKSNRRQRAVDMTAGWTARMQPTRQHSRDCRGALSTPPWTTARGKPERLPTCPQPRPRILSAAREADAPTPRGRSAALFSNRKNSRRLWPVGKPPPRGRPSQAPPQRPLHGDASAACPRQQWATRGRALRCRGRLGHAHLARPRVVHCCRQAHVHRRQPQRSPSPAASHTPTRGSDGRRSRDRRGKHFEQVLVVPARALALAGDALLAVCRFVLEQAQRKLA